MSQAWWRLSEETQHLRATHSQRPGLSQVASASFALQGTTTAKVIQILSASVLLQLESLAATGL